MVRAYLPIAVLSRGARILRRIDRCAEGPTIPPTVAPYPRDLVGRFAVPGRPGWHTGPWLCVYLDCRPVPEGPRPYDDEDRNLPGPTCEEVTP